MHSPFLHPLLLAPLPTRRDDIVRWIAKKTGPATSDIESVDVAEKLSQKPGATVLAYLSKLSGADFDAYTERERGMARLLDLTAMETLASAL